MDDFDFAEVMEEPPGGYNHGRERGEAAGWHPLETEGHDAPSFKHYVEEPRKHGTRYVYKRLRCRCDKCRAWNAAQERARITRLATPMDEDVQP